MSQSRRRLAAIMFTDMVGFTALTQTDESRAMKLLKLHNQILRPFFPKYNGKEIKSIGDSFLVEFDSALDATRCAIDLQTYLHEYRRSSKDAQGLALRIGIHLGDVMHEGGDVFGDAVNIASRVEPLAEPDGVCISEQVYAQVRNKVPQQMTRLEKRELKNVKVSMDVFKVEMPWDTERESEVGPLDRNRVAVLPFQNMSSSPDDEYFADGMTEELITTLSKVGELSVISRTSVMPYRKAPKPIKEVGKDLGAGTIIEGSVRKAGQTFRIAVQMIDAADDSHVWADSFDRNLQDVFSTQSEIANKVAEALKVKLAGPAKARIEKRPTENMEAYTAYLKGRQSWNNRTSDSIKKAQEYFSQAVEADPDFALGYSGQADCHFIIANNFAIDVSENTTAAKRLTLRALELDDDLAEGHATLAMTLQAEFKFKEADTEFKKAISLKPSYATAHQWYGQLLSCYGRWDEAYGEIERAVELDPLSPIIRSVRAEMYGTGTRNYTKAIADLKKIEETFPEADMHFSLTLAYYYDSKFEEALREIDNFKGYPPGFVAMMRASVKAKQGDKAEAERLISEAMDDKSFTLPLTAVGWVYVHVGEKDKGFEYFEKAYEIRDGLLRYLKTDPDSDVIRSDPRYISLLSKLGL